MTTKKEETVTVATPTITTLTVPPTAATAAETTTTTPIHENERNQPLIVVPYAGKRGEKVLNKLKHRIPEKIRPKVVFKGTKLSAFFPTKDEISKTYRSDLIYHYTCPTSADDYIGETKCRLGKRIEEHQGSDKESAIVRHFKTRKSPPPDDSDFVVLASNYQNRLKRRIAESIFIKEKKSNMNIQKDAYKLNLFS